MRHLLHIVGLLVASGTLLAQESGTIYFDSQWRECDKRVASYYRVFRKVSDTLYAIEDYYLSGQLQMTGHATGYREWSPSIGPHRWFHANGVQSRSVTFVRNAEDGPDTAWHANGRIKSIGRYESGRRFGLYTEWYPDGTKAMEGTFAYGRKVALWSYWHRNGSLSGRGVYDRGDESGTWDWFYDDGKPEGTGEYDQINGTGTRTWYDRTGRICAREKTRLGEIVEGTYIREDGSEHHDVAAAYRPASVNGLDVRELPAYFARRLEYPEIALRNRKEGYVELLVTIDRNGDVSDIDVELTTNQYLSKAAIAAVRGTKWSATLRHAVAVDDYIRLPFSFRMP